MSSGPYRPIFLSPVGEMVIVPTFQMEAGAQFSGDVGQCVSKIPASLYPGVKMVPANVERTSSRVPALQVVG